MRVKRGLTAFVLALCIYSIGCKPDNGAIDATATDSTAVAMSQENSTDVRTQEAKPKDDPFAVFAVESPTDVAATIASTPVWLVNESPQALIVTANGGADDVVVDTLGAGDSVLVSLDTRARWIELTARTLQGRPGGTMRLPVDSEAKRAAFPR